MSLYSRLDRLAADVEKLDRKVDSVSNSPQSQRTSVEGGSIDFNDADGNLKAIVGAQDDGGTTVNVVAGPTPPTPSGFTVDVDHGKFIVQWLGDFTTGGVAPSDWSRAEVHASQDPFFVPSRATARGSIVSAAGGEVTIGVLKGPWTIKMVSWSQAGKMSLPSQPVDVEVPGYGEIVLEEIDAAQTRIDNARAILVEGQETLGNKLDESETALASLRDTLSDLDETTLPALRQDLDVAEGRLDNAEGQITDAFGQLDAVPGQISAAQQAAIDAAALDAEAKASVAQQAAEAAAQALVDAVETGASPADIAALQQYADDAAAAAKLAADTAAQAKADQALADAKIDAKVKADAAQAAAEAKADAAMSAANGLSKVLHGTTVPTGTAPDGSIWWQHKGNLSGPVLGQWNRVSGSWKSTPIDSEAIANLDVGKLTAGAGEIATIVSQKIAAAVGQFLELDVGNLTVTGASKLASVVAEQIAADVGQFIELEVGNLIAGTGVMDEAVIKKLFAEIVVAQMVQAEEFIGENAILTGAVTASKITASEELWAKLAQFVTVYAEMVDSDVFNGRVFTGNTYLQEDGSEWSGRGLFIVNPTGETLISAPTDGTPMSLNADSTNIRSASIDELDAGDTSLTAGSTLTLEAGQLAYPRAPEVRADWRPSTTFTRPDVEDRHDWTGLAAWGDKWVRTNNVIGERSAELDSIIVYSNDGTVEKTINIDNNPRHGVAVIGDVAYVLGPDRIKRPGIEKNWVHGFDLNTGERVTRWEFTRFSGGGNRLAMGVSGSNLVVSGVHLDISRRLYVMTYNPATGAQVGSDLVTDEWVAYTKDVEGVHIDGTNMWVSHREATRRFSISGTSVTYRSTGWENPNKNAAGVDMSTGRPFVVTESGNLYEGSVFDGSGITIEATVTFRDTSGHETNASPVGMVGVPARHSASVSIPSRAGLTTRVYYREAGGDWHWWDSEDEAKRFWIGVILGAKEADPPSVNNFPRSAPSIVRAAAGRFEARADGSGWWGPLTFHADGTMTSTAVPEWVPVTTFINGAAPATFGRAPAYRVWPDGKVEWRGVVAIPDTAALTAFITVPAAANPDEVVYLSGIGNSSQQARVDIGSSSTIRAQPFTGNTLRWFSLDTVFYYLT